MASDLTSGQMDKVREAYSNFLMYANQPLSIVFGGRIPASLLPYPKEVIDKVLVRLEEQSIRAGEAKMLNTVRGSRTFLDSTVTDEEGLERLKDSTKTSDLLTMAADWQQENYIKLKKEK